MKRYQILRATVALAAVMAATSVQATLDLRQPPPLGYDTPSIVGTVEGQPGDSSFATELGYAQALVAMAAGQTSGYFKTSNTEYTAPVSTVGHQLAEGVTKVLDKGYTYALAKYDGKNAGYILFYLGGEDAILPKYPYNLWTTEEKWALSHITVFGTAVPEPTTMVAAALLLLPFGASMLRVLRNRRTA